MDENVLDAPELTSSHELADAVAWWERKRIWFNLAVGLVGAICSVLFVLNYHYSPGTFDLIIIAVWGVIVNLCYCAGFGAEALAWHYSGGKRSLAGGRWTFFIVGTLLTALVTATLAGGF